MLERKIKRIKIKMTVKGGVISPPDKINFCDNDKEN